MEVTTKKHKRRIK